MVADRWEKAKLLGFGEGASVYDSALVLGDVQVGAHTWIGPNVVLDGSGAPLRIGDYCSVSAGVQFYTHNSVAWAVTGGRSAYAHASVSIGSCVYFGPNTIVAQGVTIGSHCIVGAQSFVNSSLPAYAVAWGQPAAVVGRVVMNEDESDYTIVYNHTVNTKEADNDSSI